MNLRNLSRHKLSIIGASLSSIGLMLFMLISGTSSAEAASKRPPTRTPTLTPTPPAPTFTPTPASTQTLNGTWRVVRSPNTSTYSNALHGVAVVSANDVWAVGSAFDESLIMHWDGSSWRLVLSPSPGNVYNALNAVAAVTSNDVWAVGYYDDETLILHWDGAAWTQVPSPSQPDTINVLSGIAVVNANDIWAVGEYSGSLTLIEHWDGVQWSIVPSPNPSSLPYNYLYGVTALASNNVWAVGSYAVSGTSPRTLVIHWDGTSWSVVPSPNQDGTNGYSGYSLTNVLRSVAAVSADDIWAVGSYGTTSLIEHWNGSAWSIVPNPNVQSQENYLESVAPVAANDVWAVGYSQTVLTDPTGEYQEYYPSTLIEHWNGAYWSIISSPNPSTVPDNQLFGVAVVSPNEAWAVGDYDSNTLTEHYTVP
jgi:hypothetical protein